MHHVHIHIRGSLDKNKPPLKCFFFKWNLSDKRKKNKGIELLYIVWLPVVFSPYILDLLLYFAIT